jgi:hypothetical protein
MSKTTAELIAAFKSNGGRVQQLETGDRIGITEREWDQLVRGDAAPIEVPVLRTAFVEQRLRAGHGAA